MDDPADKPRINQQTLDALGESFVEDVSRYIVPIFTDVEGAPVSWGTGFLLDTGFGHALVTAAHVLDGFYAGKEYYLYSAPAMKRAIVGEALFSKLPPSGSRNDDLVDVVIVLLEGKFDELPPFDAVGKTSMPLDLLAPQAAPRHGKKYAFLGFPASKGKVNRVVKDVRSASFAYLASSVPPDAYAQIHVEETFHIVLPFEKRNVINLEAEKLNFPALQGMSGSPLWELRRVEDGGRRVVGVMIRDKHKRDHVVVAADIYFVVKILFDHFRSKGLIT
jgi:hypothetical protein